MYLNFMYMVLIFFQNNMQYKINRNTFHSKYIKTMKSTNHSTIQGMQDTSIVFCQTD